MVFQLDSQKKEINEVKQLIDELSEKLNSKVLVEKSTLKNEAEVKEESFNRE